MININILELKLGLYHQYRFLLEGLKRRKEKWPSHESEYNFEHHLWSYL